MTTHCSSTIRIQQQLSDARTMAFRTFFFMYWCGALSLYTSQTSSPWEPETLLIQQCHTQF
ncbi:hypothetical protein U9M48_038932 [Paspalum notatum var. saurae]|uniref:Uncharacterized protein n=1 Tax=Paspalum notatum var. saurae TaxID=547442 RepID=A0AAQ3UHU6_PASNO